MALPENPGSQHPHRNSLLPVCPVSQDQVHAVIWILWVPDAHIIYIHENKTLKDITKNNSIFKNDQAYKMQQKQLPSKIPTAL